MLNKLKKIHDNLDIIVIFMWMLFIPITVLLTYFGEQKFNYTTINIILSIILTYTYLYKLIKSKFKIKIYDIIIFILLILNSLSTTFAIDRELAIFGASRGNGFLTLITYSLIILNLIRVKDKKKIKFLIITMICIGIINVIYSCLQVFTYVPNIYRFYKLYMASALSVNPNFFGAFMSLLLTLVISLFVFNKKNQILYFCFSLIFLIGLYLSQSTGPLVGGICSLIFLLVIILIYYRSYIKRFIFIISILSIIFIGIDKGCRLYYDLRGYELDERYMIVGGLEDIYKFIGKNIFGMKVEVPENSGNGRLRLWKDSIPLLKKYPILGCGTDNFKLVFYQYAYPLVFIDAHNIYLNYAINNGIPAALIFIFALLYVLFKAIKTRDKTILALSIGYVSYCVQAFFNISVIQVSTYFYIFTALLIAYIEINNKLGIDKKIKK